MSVLFVFFFFKQKTAYEMRISDWSSDVCSSDLGENAVGIAGGGPHPGLPVFRHAGGIAGPAVRIGGAGAVKESQRHGASGRARHPEMEPLVKVGLPVADDLQIGALPVRPQETDVARIERGRNR